MKNQFLITFMILFSINTYGQTTTQLEYTKIILQNDSTIKADLLFSTSDYYYFKRYNYTEETIFKIATSQVKSCEHNKNKGEMNLGVEFIKFSNQAKTGIILSLLGTAGMIILPIAVVSTIAVAPGGIVVIIGFIVWADSYSHTKKIGIIMSAKDYPY